MAFKDCPINSCTANFARKIKASVRESERRAVLLGTSDQLSNPAVSSERVFEKLTLLLRSRAHLRDRSASAGSLSPHPASARRPTCPGTGGPGRRAQSQGGRSPAATLWS